MLLIFAVAHKKSACFIQEVWCFITAFGIFLVVFVVVVVFGGLGDVWVFFIIICLVLVMAFCGIFAVYLIIISHMYEVHL